MSTTLSIAEAKVLKDLGFVLSIEETAAHFYMSSYSGHVLKDNPRIRVRSTPQGVSLLFEAAAYDVGYGRKKKRVAGAKLLVKRHELVASKDKIATWIEAKAKPAVTAFEQELERSKLARSIAETEKAARLDAWKQATGIVVNEVMYSTLTAPSIRKDSNNAYVFQMGFAIHGSPVEVGHKLALINAVVGKQVDWPAANAAIATITNHS